MSKGLDSLANLMDEEDQAGTGAPSEVAIELIARDPLQPRKTFDEEKLRELAASIAAQGVIQPIVIRPDPDGNGYFVLVGERRWRGAQIAGLETVPVVIREIEGSVLAMQLGENLDREAVPILEESAAIEQLIKELGKAGAVAKALGKKPAWVSVRRKIAKGVELLTPLVESGATRDPETLGMLVDLKKLNPQSYARAVGRPAIARAYVRQLLDSAKGKTDETEPPTPKQETATNKPATEETESVAGDNQGASQEPSAGKEAAPKPPRESLQKKYEKVLGKDTESEQEDEPGTPWVKGSDLETIDRMTQELAELLGAKVTMHSEGEGGYLRIDYANMDELDQVLSHIS
ncbi:MAG: ParB/RepB/Spo0J family partition protein [Candidatus Sedimenticola endophacoides]